MAAKHFSPSSNNAKPNHRQRRRFALGMVIAGAVLLILALGLSGIFVSGKNSSLLPVDNNTTDEQSSTNDARQSSISPHDENPTSTPNNQPVDITITAVGDVLQHQGVWESGLQPDGTYNFDHVYANLDDALSGSDLNVLNQESILGGDIAPFSSYPSFNGPQEMGDAEVKAGFNVILRASNHTMDMGYDGLASELTFWATQHPEVALLGAADPDLHPSAESPDTSERDDATASVYSTGVPLSVNDVCVFEKDGFRVALLNYTYDLNGYSDPRGLVSILSEDHVRQTLVTAHEVADMVVVFPHWGEEYQTAPVASQRQWKEFFRQNGADVIIGSHPHVLEPVETFERASGGTGVCFWSLGNFVSGQAKNETLVGGMARVTLRKDTDGTCSVTAATLEPVITHKGIGTAMTVYRLRDYTNELAATNAFPNAANYTLTPAWAQDFCTQVLGSLMLQISVYKSP